jgi:hypothetical protein
LWHRVPDPLAWVEGADFATGVGEHDLGAVPRRGGVDAEDVARLGGVGHEPLTTGGIEEECGPLERHEHQLVTGPHRLVRVARRALGPRREVSPRPRAVVGVERLQHAGEHELVAGPQEPVAAGAVRVERGEAQVAPCVGGRVVGGERPADPIARWAVGADHDQLVAGPHRCHHTVTRELGPWGIGDVTPLVGRRVVRSAVVVALAAEHDQLGARPRERRPRPGREGPGIELVPPGPVPEGRVRGDRDRYRRHGRGRGRRRGFCDQVGGVVAAAEREDAGDEGDHGHARNRGQPDGGAAPAARRGRELDDLGVT